MKIDTHLCVQVVALENRDVRGQILRTHHGREFMAKLVGERMCRMVLSSFRLEPLSLSALSSSAKSHNSMRVSGMQRDTNIAGLLTVSYFTFW